jgi:hypothetical protein
MIIVKLYLFASPKIIFLSFFDPGQVFAKDFTRRTKSAAKKNISAARQANSNRGQTAQMSAPDLAQMSALNLAQPQH